MSFLPKFSPRSPRQSIRKLSLWPLVLVLSLATAVTSVAFSQEEEDDKYDRLDGHGTSGKRVNVIEWEGNLEIHVYPKGSLAGLALKVDRKNKERPVMVIGYRFDNGVKLIRRAILGIRLSDQFKTYQDLTADDYDKVIISNNGLSGQVVAYQLDAPPTQLYPDGHPANGGSQVAENKPTPGPSGLRPADLDRTPASGSSGSAAAPAPAQAPVTGQGATPTAEVSEDGAIRPFRW